MLRLRVEQRRGAAVAPGERTPKGESERAKAKGRSARARGETDT
jgi:hypothetical protein